MAEQISHKKSLRVANLKKDRRMLLKEFYNLEDAEHAPQQPKQEEEPVKEVVEIMDVESATSTSNVSLEERPISELGFKDLIHIHNTLLSKETETNNSIKNTIYDNYYDLIKVNDLLKQMTQDNQTQLEQLKETVKSVLQ